MVKLKSVGPGGASGVVVEAMEAAAPGMLASGMFALCDGESLPDPKPDPKPDPEPVPQPDAEEEPGFALGAFAEEGPEGDLEAMTVAQLREIAEGRGLDVQRKARKSDLIALNDGGE